MTQFSDLKLDPKVLKAIEEAGYTTPTPIQAGAIPPALEGRDVLGIAQTGTGKTAGFVLPMITLLGRGRARARMPRSLVLCPTRELAAQVAENFDTYAKHTRLTKVLLIGGVSMRDQETLISRGVDVLIATPGRLLDHFERGNLLLQGVQIMVVDEADRMLDMGFIPDIERIFQLTPFTRQTLFFSATMAPEIERITDTFLHSPERIEVARQATASETITQKLIEITPTRKDQTARQKRELLRAVIENEGRGLKNAIIFCNRKTEVDIVAKSLKAHGYDAAPIHGDLEQRVRTATLDGFREGTLRFLVASDVAARGLDIPAVSHVFNFDLPSHAEDYVHRIGRTGRAGREGTAISLGVPADEKYLAAIENLVKKTLPRAPAPEGFALSDASRAEPAARDEGRDGARAGSARSRTRGGRSRSRAPRDDEAAPRAELSPQAEVPARPEPAAAAPERVEAPRREPETPRTAVAEPRKEERREPVRGGSREERRDEPRPERRDGRRDERRDERRDRGRDERRSGPQALGLGEHVPEFMTRSFLSALESLGKGAAGEPGAAQVSAPSAAAEVPATIDAPAAARAEKPKARGRGRSAGRDTGTVPLAAPNDGAAENVAAAAGAGEPAAGAQGTTATAPEASPAAEPVAERAKPAAKRRSPRSKPASPPSVSGAADLSATPAPAAKPASRRRSRKPVDNATDAAPPGGGVAGGAASTSAAV